MNFVQTAYFGELQYGDDSVYQFPVGLPGFEDHRLFVLIQRPDVHPLAFLQSLDRIETCFIGMPVRAIHKDYDLRLTEQELADLGFAPASEPRIGHDLLCLALIACQEDSAATANLRAPIVINLASNRGIQSIQDIDDYSHRHPVVERRPELKCS
jgi:flagellar assembly factor FliW